MGAPHSIQNTLAKSIKLELLVSNAEIRISGEDAYPVGSGDFWTG